MDLSNQILMNVNVRGLVGLNSSASVATTAATLVLISTNISYPLTLQLTTLFQRTESLTGGLQL